MAESKSRNINKSFSPTGGIEATAVVTTTGTPALPSTGAALDSGSVQGLKHDIFRINSQRLRQDFTIHDSDNASTVGPITVDSGVSLTINGNYVVL
jgi:hypothetical protein